MVNKVILVGNVGNDPEIRSFDNGTKCAEISLATTERWKDKNGEKQSKTTWHSVVYYGPLAEVVEKYVKKGSKLYVEGSISKRSYEKDGNTVWVTEVKGRELTMMDSKPQANPQSTADQVMDGAAEVDDDSLPF